ncbi:uncharacterized protein B4U79_16067 [Dinothrombium tinctorium]|uniref:Uncharacterized protein n=1 Tax=Dinothrombium tinctorium TaxID=1965070 RepID=A0A3S3P4S8_9ACAR|nr:uncharacterized protein B4U79_04188 [Dinothrombium tinctorium]RWS14917.1 uncharacterized protein B4U79_07246 [Dinothrombium tinctorium]RWS16765.1 uncharacterized protein B4U79_16067 [Dinothrombium tinctorium]
MISAKTHSASVAQKVSRNAYNCKYECDNRSKEVITEDEDHLLHAAVLTENVKLVTHLVDILSRNSAASSIDCFNISLQTPLHLAVCVGNEDIIRILIEKGGASLHLVDRNGNNVLHLAVKYEKRACIKLLLNYLRNNDKVLNALNNDGLAPLHLACHCKHFEEIIVALVRGGVDVDVVDGLSGRTPLMYALQNFHRNTKLHQLLLTLKCDPWLADYSGNKPIDLLQNI